MSFASHLSSTISEYKELIKNIQFSLLFNPVEDLLNSFESIAATYESKRSKSAAIETRLKALKEIFTFYAKQIKMIGSALSFEQIVDHQSILNISKFTKFCSDFDITNKQNKDHITVQQATQAFLIGNDCSRSMNFNQFVSAIDALADIYFDKKYDLRNNSSFSMLPISEKKEKIYEFLQLNDKNEYMKRAKGFGLPFSKEKAGYRLPENDLSKNYKFKDNTKQKQMISQWKKIKEEPPIVSRSISVPNPARLAAVKNSLIQRKDRVTWDLLKNSQQSSLISKEDLGSLFTDDDIKEMMSVNKGSK